MTTKHTIINDFSTLTPESSYWAGFIFGDGCIKTHNRLCIELTGRDDETIKHLKKLSMFVCGNDYVRITVKKNIYYKNGINKKTCTFELSDKNICNNLSKFGIIPRKTYCSHLILPQKYKSDFIRGYFDADGSFTKACVISFLSLLPENLYIINKEFPVQVNVRAYHYPPKRKCYKLVIGAKNEVKSVLEYMCTNNKNICFEKKWNRINNWLQNNPNITIREKIADPKNYVNKKYGELTVVSIFFTNNQAHAYCKCSCGNYHTTTISNLKTSKVKSCGCKQGNRKYAK